MKLQKSSPTVFWKPEAPKIRRYPVFAFIIETNEQTSRTMELLRRYPGPSDVGLYFTKEQKKLKGKNFRINAGEPKLLQSLKDLLGEENVVWKGRI